MYGIPQRRLTGHELYEAIASIDRAASRLALGRPSPKSCEELEQARDLIESVLRREAGNQRQLSLSL